jgi:DNA-binding LacI/PurR family transcriptional regulator
MATIHDVAQAAGVSISTVSYALSGKRSIASTTRQRVTDAVERLGYRPHAGARMLAGARTNILALSAPIRADNHQPTQMRFVTAVVEAARRRDYDVLLLATDDEVSGIRRVATSASSWSASSICPPASSASRVTSTTSRASTSTSSRRPRSWSTVSPTWVTPPSA